MTLTPLVQENLLALLCFDNTPRGARLVRSLISYKTFDVYFRDIAQEAEKYLDKYKKCPGEHTLDIFASIKERQPDAEDIYDRIYSSLRSTAKGINREYVISQASLFARFQRIKRGVTEAIDALNDPTEEKINQADAILEKCRKSSANLFDPGLRFTDYQRGSKFLDMNQDDVFKTGVKQLDDLRLGPARKQLHLMAALYGKGKTHWLVGCLGRTALMTRRRVLHVTLEMSEEKMYQRYCSALFSITKRKQEVEYKKFKEDELGRFIGFKDRVIKDRPSYEDDNIRPLLRSKIKSFEKRPGLIIKQFPTGQLTIPELRAYLDALEGTANFMPDLLIIDYPDLMQFDAKFERQELSRIYKELRGIGVERNIAVAAVTQANREAEYSKSVQGKHVGKDFDKLATVDVFLTYSQTEAEHELNLARLFVGKGREDKDRFTILLSQAYAIGQFCMDSVMMSNTYWGAIKTDDNEDDE